MIRNLTALLLTLTLLTGAALTQTAKQSDDTSQIKTVRVHIDGFMKSKSGAV